LGISPTGSYKNGNGAVTYDNDGFAITSGSNTSAYSHYGSPLYADTLLWANEGWIDYLIPQTYWEIDNKYGPFADLADWWSKALKNVDTKLYLGIGIYKYSSSSAGSWYDDENELINQVMIAQKYDKIEGLCFFSYRQLLYVENDSTASQNKALKTLKNELWNTYVNPPKFE